VASAALAASGHPKAEDVPLSTPVPGKLANFFGEDPNVAKPDMILGRVGDLLDKV
jgi:hypothetical protein